MRHHLSNSHFIDDANQECEGCAGGIDWEELRPLPELLDSLVVGDLFHARGPGGQSIVCLVLDLTETTISARRVPTFEHYVFDISTGVEQLQGSGRPSRIASVEPLPIDLHNTLLWLDRRYRLRRLSNRFESRGDLKALLVAEEYYARYPVQGAVSGGNE